MRHPSLPPEQVIEVTERAAIHHGNAGWVSVDEPPAESAPPAEPQASESEPETPRGRRVKKEL